MENKIINEKLNLIKKCVESYQIIPDNVAIMLMEQITNILSTVHVCGKEQRKFLDEVERKFQIEPHYPTAKKMYCFSSNMPESRVFSQHVDCDLSKVIAGE